MKQDLKVLAEHIEKKVGKAHVFHKMWDVLKGKEKLPARLWTSWRCSPDSRVGMISKVLYTARRMGL